MRTLTELLLAVLLAAATVLLIWVGWQLVWST